METHTFFGRVELDNVGFTGTRGADGSTLNWNGFASTSDADETVTDNDGDGLLDATGSPDTFNVFFNFTGYTIPVGLENYGVFEFTFAPGKFWVILPEDGSTQTTIPSHGTSNTYQAEAPAYMCFGEGTLIATPNEEVAVEQLKIGDLIRTSDGRDVPVKWIGKQTLAKLFAGSKAQLVCIRAGALGNHTDLYVTGDHGMVLDGYMINASALVNDCSIHWVSFSETPDRQTVYHVETEEHDIILANGAASETYLDVPNRQAFDNYQEYLDLYGAEKAVSENQMPRISSRRLLPKELLERLGIEPAVKIAV